MSEVKPYSAKLDPGIERLVSRNSLPDIQVLTIRIVQQLSYAEWLPRSLHSAFKISCIKKTYLLVRKIFYSITGISPFGRKKFPVKLEKISR
jgi:hypothetical protein